VLAVLGQPNRFVFHGVHMLFDGKEDRAWLPGEERESIICFIGRGLDRAALEKGFRACFEYCEEGAQQQQLLHED
jgi:G3E family GTPase